MKVLRLTDTDLRNENHRPRQHLLLGHCRLDLRRRDHRRLWRGARARLPQTRDRGPGRRRAAVADRPLRLPLRPGGRRRCDPQLRPRRPAGGDDPARLRRRHGVRRQRTTFGRRGFGRRRQLRGGAPGRHRVNAVRVAVFTISGSMAAIGGVMAASRLFAVNQIRGQRPPLLAIAGPVIAGTSLFGGRGSVWTALLGALVIGSISNGMDLPALLGGETDGHRRGAAASRPPRRRRRRAAPDLRCVRAAAGETSARAWLRGHCAVRRPQSPE